MTGRLAQYGLSVKVNSSILFRWRHPYASAQPLGLPRLVTLDNHFCPGLGANGWRKYGHTGAGKVKDSRQIVPLTEEERSIVAAEMRQMLASIQGVTDGLSRGDMQTVIEAASKSGVVMMQELPSQIRMKFPAPFSQMGMASHKAFDRIARETKSIKDPLPVLKQLSVGMRSCIACHAAYHFAPPK